MSYKSQLQTNNNTIVGNNTDLQSILNTINNLPAATESIDLDAEITAQDTVISQIQEALINKSSNNLDTSDATATADDIAKDKTAYVDGVKITGTHECSGGGDNVGTATVTVQVSGGDSAQCFYYNNGQLYAQSVEGFMFNDAEENFTVDINSCFIIATLGGVNGWTRLLEADSIYYDYKIITESIVVS